MNYDLIQHPSMASSWNLFHLETCWMLVRGSCFFWWESQAAHLILLLFSIWTFEDCSTRDVFCLDQWSIFSVLSRLLRKWLYKNAPCPLSPKVCGQSVIPTPVILKENPSRHDKSSMVPREESIHLQMDVDYSAVFAWFSLQASGSIWSWKSSYFWPF